MDENTRSRVLRAVGQLIRAAELARSEQFFVMVHDKPPRVANALRVSNLLKDASAELIEVMPNQAWAEIDPGRTVLIDIQESAHYAAIGLIDWLASQNETAIAASSDALGIAVKCSDQFVGICKSQSHS